MCFGKNLSCLISHFNGVYQQNRYGFCEAILKKPTRYIFMENCRKLSLTSSITYTVMILSFRTDRSEQTAQTQIRLLLPEQSDQGLYCLQSVCIVWMHCSTVKPLCSNLRVITANVSGIRIFMVCSLSVSLVSQRNVICCPLSLLSLFD